MKGSTKDKLKKLANSIYETGVELFGIKESKKPQQKRSRPFRRTNKLVKLRKERKDLKRKWKAAREEEKEGLKILCEELKEKCHMVQRSILRAERRRISRRTREKFLRNPYEFTKKMFVEARSGTLECTKDELDDHIKTTYSDAQRKTPLAFMEGLKYPTRPGREFNLGDLKAKEVDDFVRKATEKSAPGRDGVSYKVYKYCNRLRNKLLGRRLVLRRGNLFAQGS